MVAPIAGPRGQSRYPTPDRHDRLAIARKTRDRGDVLTARKNPRMSRRTNCVTLPKEALMTRGQRRPLSLVDPARRFYCVSIAVAIALIAWGCSQELTAIENAGGAGGATVGSAGSDAGSCANTGDTCTYSHPCCSGYCTNGRCPAVDSVDAGDCLSRACSQSGTCCQGESCQAIQDSKYCVDPNYTQINPDSCTLPSDCASLSCESGQCSSGPPCAVFTSGCTAPGDCCSNLCSISGQCAESGSCSVTGDFCGPAVNCCTPNSCVKLGSISRCLPFTCRSIGDICTNDNQCCSPFYCVNHQCAQSPQNCLIKGSPCSTSGSPPCCSQVCSSQGTCVPLDGCQPLYEICSADTDCCSGNCTAGRCTSVTGTNCGQEGELCSNLPCCGTATCISAGYGLTRCSNQGPSCYNNGDTCAYGAQCCQQGQGLQCVHDSTQHYTCQPN